MGGFLRVIEFFEVCNLFNFVVVFEIDGVVFYGKIKCGNCEIIVESCIGELKKYLINLSKQILVQENDYVCVGMLFLEGVIILVDIFVIQGLNCVQEYLVNEI